MPSVGQKDVSAGGKQAVLGTQMAHLSLQETRWRHGRRGVDVSYLRAGGRSLSCLHQFSQENRSKVGRRR